MRILIVSLVVLLVSLAPAFGREMKVEVTYIRTSDGTYVVKGQSDSTSNDLKQESSDDGQKITVVGTMTVPDEAPVESRPVLEPPRSANVPAQPQIIEKTVQVPGADETARAEARQAKSLAQKALDKIEGAFTQIGDIGNRLDNLVADFGDTKKEQNSRTGALESWRKDVVEPTLQRLNNGLEDAQSAARKASARANWLGWPSLLLSIAAIVLVVKTRRTQKTPSQPSAQPSPTPPAPTRQVQTPSQPSTQPQPSTPAQREPELTPAELQIASAELIAQPQGGVA